MGQVYIGIELKNDSYEIDPQADAAHSTGDFENATAALEEGMHFDLSVINIQYMLFNCHSPTQRLEVFQVMFENTVKHSKSTFQKCYQPGRKIQKYQ